MEWVVEYTDEFGEWWETLADDEQISIDAHVQKLEQRGPNCRSPILARSKAQGMPTCGN
jgi:hypothetical protein